MSQGSNSQLNSAVRGELTGVSLNETDCLFVPQEPDAFGIVRRPLTRQGMKLSLELARMAYTLNVEPWMRAGWMDFSIQVDNQLTTGLKTREEDGFTDRVQALIGSLRLTRVRMALREHNPLARVTGALRQRSESDTIKAVVMVRPTANARFLVAIGFMGTGARFYDWFSNLRVGMEDGFHQGFYQLTQAFIKNENEILFPDTADMLGLRQLTLKDILMEMRREDSRFSLWMAGHSQGAAVMQVYSVHLLKEMELARGQIVGCGFASPTVAADNTVSGGPAYPLTHVLNADDLVPRMGSLKHFGLCLQFRPDAKFREIAYGWSGHEADRVARKAAERLTLHIVDTPSFLIAFTALLQVICEEKSDEVIFGGSEWLLSIAPIEKVFSFAGKKAKETLGSMIVYMRKTYRDILRREMDEAAVNFLMERFRPLVTGMPLKRLLTALYDHLYPPHSLYNSTENGAYWRIVNERSEKLKPFIWEEGSAAQPHRRYAKGYYTYDEHPATRHARPPARRSSPRRRAIHVRR